MVPTQTMDDDEQNDALWLDALWQTLHCGRSWMAETKTGDRSAIDGGGTAR